MFLLQMWHSQSPSTSTVSGEYSTHQGCQILCLSSLYQFSVHQRTYHHLDYLFFFLQLKRLTLKSYIYCNLALCQHMGFFIQIYFLEG